VTIPERPKQFVGRFSAVWLVAGLLCLSLTPATASPQGKETLQKDYALIYGTVWSAQEFPVPGVRVKIRRASDKKARWELVSDRNGEFAQRVPSGQMDYVILAEVKTHKGKAKAETTAHVENDERVDVGLHLTE
jgi:hypothetical protein